MKLLYASGITAFMQHVTVTSVKITQKQQLAKLGMLTERQAMILSDKVANELKDEPDRHLNP